MANVDVKQLLASVPKVLPHSRQRPELQYELADDLIATPATGHHSGALPPVPGGMAVRAVEEGGVPEATPIMPVYRRGAAGGVVVPTGRVLVRFSEGDSAEAHRDELAAAGYDLDEVLSYAPQAGWARAASGSIADTLGHLDRLERIHGIENVEVQMVGEVGRR
jgi:hypothetical protein